MIQDEVVPMLERWGADRRSAVRYRKDIVHPPHALQSSWSRYHRYRSDSKGRRFFRQTKSKLLEMNIHDLRT